MPFSSRSRLQAPLCTSSSTSWQADSVCYLDERFSYQRRHIRLMQRPWVTEEWLLTENAIQEKESDLIYLKLFCKESWRRGSVKTPQYHHYCLSQIRTSQHGIFLPLLSFGINYESFSLLRVGSIPASASHDIEACIGFAFLFPCVFCFTFNL